MSKHNRERRQIKRKLKTLSKYERLSPLEIVRIHKGGKKTLRGTNTQ